MNFSRNSLCHFYYSHIHLFIISCSLLFINIKLFSKNVQTWQMLWTLDNEYHKINHFYKGMFQCSCFDATQYSAHVLRKYSMVQCKKLSNCDKVNFYHQASFHLIILSDSVTCIMISLHNTLRSIIKWFFLELYTLLLLSR